MQTGTKKTPDRFQNYFCPAAANDIVHHAYAWIVKEPNMQPKFLYCRAIDDPVNDRGWNIIAEVWERDVLGGWGISSSTIHPEFEDTADGYVLAEGMPGTAASLPYQVFREVVNEHDTNYLIALAIAIDALPIPLATWHLKLSVQTPTSISPSAARASFPTKPASLPKRRPVSSRLRTSAAMRPFADRMKSPGKGEPI